MNYTCPVCAFTRMHAPPRNYEICPCCGTEFGNDDELLTHEQLRAQWIQNGARWFFREPPANWNPWYQLIEGNHAESVPFSGTFVARTATVRGAIEGPDRLRVTVAA
jgi:hypothetical protein